MNHRRPCLAASDGTSVCSRNHIIQRLRDTRPAKHDHDGSARAICGDTPAGPQQPLLSTPCASMSTRTAPYPRGCL
jgi:hypothetical protein